MPLGAHARAPLSRRSSGIPEEQLPHWRTEMGYFAAREAQTSLSCPACGKKLKIARTCHRAYMVCPSCGQTFPLRDFIEKADEAMEDFLNNCFIDRI